MPDGTRPDPGLLRFIASAVALSVVLTLALHLATACFGHSVAGSWPMVPVLSAILSARGAPWGQKATFAGLAAGGLLSVDTLARVLGFAQIMRTAEEAVDPFASLVGVLHSTFVWTFPLAVLALFIGRRPARLWRA